MHISLFQISATSGNGGGGGGREKETKDKVEEGGPFGEEVVEEDRTQAADADAPGSELAFISAAGGNYSSGVATAAAAAAATTTLATLGFLLRGLAAGIG